jgi:hypothetical protein
MLRIKRAVQASVSIQATVVVEKPSQLTSVIQFNTSTGYLAARTAAARSGAANGKGETANATTGSAANAMAALEASAGGENRPTMNFVP